MIIEIEYRTGETYRAEVPPEAFCNTGACLLDDDSVLVIPERRES